MADVVLLRSDIEVTPGWLDELADVVYSEQRTACVSPLINHDGYCSVAVHDSGEHFEVRRRSDGARRLCGVATLERC